MESKSSEAGVFDSREQVSLDQVVRIEHRTLGRREDQFVRDTALPSGECFQHSAISKVKQHTSKLSRQIYAARLLALWRRELPGDKIVLNEDVPVRIFVAGPELYVTPLEGNQLTPTQAGPEGRKEEGKVFRADIRSPRPSSHPRGKQSKTIPHKKHKSQAGTMRKNGIEAGWCHKPWLRGCSRSG